MYINPNVIEMFLPKGQHVGPYEDDTDRQDDYHMFNIQEGHDWNDHMKDIVISRRFFDELTYKTL